MTRTHSPTYELSAIKPRRSLNTGDHVLLTEICYNNFLLCWKIPMHFNPWNFDTTVISLQPFVRASCGLRAGCHQRCGASNETGERSGTGQSPSGSLKDTVLDGIEPLRSLPFMYWLFACTFRTFNYESFKLFSMENVYVIYVCILSIWRLHARAI